MRHVARRWNEKSASIAVIRQHRKPGSRIDGRVLGNTVS
jgi:hypothetical protein